MTFNAIGKEQYQTINNHVNLIHESADNMGKLEMNIAGLDSDCVMCYHVLHSLSKTNLECAKRLEQWKMYNNNKTLVKQNDNLQNEIYKTRKAVWLNGNTKATDIAWFIVFMKWVVIIILAPLLMLPRALTDPYKLDFCSNHFTDRPIKKERIRRFAIYGIVTLVWFVTVGVTIL